MINKDNEILEYMERYGGSFASSIAIAACHADSFNYPRLKRAFPELWEEYAQLADLAKRNKGAE